MSLQTPLAKAQGLGSAKQGSHHWWAQRVTAVALVPLTIWLAFSIALIPEASYENVLAWFSSTWNATLAISFLIATFYHAALGMQIVYEDYIHKECAKVTMVVGTQLAMVLLAIGSVVAVLKLAVGG